MKKIIFTVLIICLNISCRSKVSLNTAAENQSSIPESFDWLPGNWQRVNEAPDKQIYERWVKIGNKEYTGFGYTLKNTDTIWQEDIKLVKHDSTWNFEVMGKGEDQPTIFRIKNFEPGRFNAENQANEFPKNITYSKNGDKLHAVISGGGEQIQFDFTRLKEINN